LQEDLTTENDKNSEEIVYQGNGIPGHPSQIDGLQETSDYSGVNAGVI
jgi:hypothetical protein